MGDTSGKCCRGADGFHPRRSDLPRDIETHTIFTQSRCADCCRLAGDRGDLDQSKDQGGGIMMEIEVVTLIDKGEIILDVLG